MTSSKNAALEYQALLTDFVVGELSVTEFQAEYLSRVKNEKRRLDEELFEILEEVFGDVDSYSSDCELLQENPGFYLDEDALKRKLNIALARIFIFNQADL